MARTTPGKDNPQVCTELERIKNLESQTKKHDERFDDHTKRIVDLEKGAARLSGIGTAVVWILGMITTLVVTALTRLLGGPK